MATTPEIRRAPANLGYRYPNEDELVEGTELLRVDIDSEYQTQCPKAGSLIRIDKDPLWDNHGTPTVYYHSTRRAERDYQCFAPVSHLTTGYHEPDRFHPGGPRHEFWVKIDFSKL